MKQNYTELVCIIDRSGSMSSIATDTIGGFNTFMAEQKKLGDETNVTLVLFDDKYEVVHDNIDINKIPILDDNTFVPRGMTALSDAIGKTITTVGERLAKTKEEERPSSVIFCIITDGDENSSKEYKASKIKEMITHQEQSYLWKFTFLAANIDATETALNYGISRGASYNFKADSMSTSKMFTDISFACASYSKGDRGFDLNSLQEPDPKK
jgi:uncharacterized protein YegL